MSITTYAELQTALGNWLDHSLYSARYGEFVQLFEAFANRKLRVRQQEATTILVPSNPAAITVTGAANNGSGLIRLTVSSTSTYTTGNEVTVGNVNGTTEANGAWLVTVISGTTLDLQGSTFTNAYVSGGTVTALVGIATLPTDYLAWKRATWTGQTRRDLAYVDPAYFVASFPTRPADVPAFFTIEGTTLKITPTDTTPIEFEYLQAIPSIVTNSTNWLLSAHPDLYLFGSMVEAETFGVNDERLAMWKMRRDEIIGEIINLSNKTRAPSAIRIFGPTP